jgi:2-phospho-L-lactate transferase/gluconeogenesis factor (CofD/UPF0052 family)
VTRIRVVLFTGGRGSQVLSRELISDPRIELTLAVNGYDDGKSTGEVRRFLGSCLGPSDFRKNGSTLAGALRSCAPELIQLLDLRFPEPCDRAMALAGLAAVGSEPAETDREVVRRIGELASRVTPATRAALARRLAAFEGELARSAGEFAFSDCSLGNLVFAGCFLGAGRRFNEANDDYSALLDLPPGCIENVTDGTNAYLVAIDRNQRLLASEADIVDANRRNYIQDIYLIDRRLSPEEPLVAGEASLGEIEAFLREHSVDLPPNKRLLRKLEQADLVIYAPGTQHSSLLPSYLTRELGATIARNLGAIKILVTNLQEDAEIPDLSAVGILEKALYYLRLKNQVRIPTPCLITHCLLNDAVSAGAAAPYVPLGRIQSFEDPRLVRIANYEEGLSGRHDPRKVLTPFIEALLRRREAREVAILLLDAQAPDKIYQSVIETLRGGLEALDVRPTFFCASPDALDPSFTGSLPFRVHNVWQRGQTPEQALLAAVRHQPFDYVVLFESSGMYRGEDVVRLLAALASGDLDAVWGSRRLSRRQVRESYQLRYRHSPVLRAVSYVGSNLLSVAYWMLYGRFVSDTLSGARVLRTSLLEAPSIDLGDKCLNQHLLSMLLRAEGEIFEVPVDFFAMSPKKVKRTSVMEGLRSLRTILSWRLRRCPPATETGDASATCRA